VCKYLFAENYNQAAMITTKAQNAPRMHRDILQRFRGHPRLASTCERACQPRPAACMRHPCRGPRLALVAAASGPGRPGSRHRGSELTKNAQRRFKGNSRQSSAGRSLRARGWALGWFPHGREGMRGVALPGGRAGKWQKGLPNPEAGYCVLSTWDKHLRYHLSILNKPFKVLIKKLI
jgi:hypothetical protein